MRCSLVLLIVAFVVSPPNFAHSADVQTISHGERVDIQAHLAPGKLTLVDFFADWCGPCRALAPTLNRLADEHADRFALRKIDISKAGAPAGAQYGVSTIPHLILFDEDGNLVREGNPGPVLRELERRLGGGGGRSPFADGGFPVVPAVVLLLIVVGVTLYLRQSRAREPSPGRHDSGYGPSRVASAGPQNDATWFAMIQDSLEGPFSIEELENMLAGRILSGDARVRRRGDAQWQRLGDVVG